MDVESDSDSVQVDSARIFSLNSLSVKSRTIYETAYNGFMEWREENKHTSFSEKVLITYFEEIKDKFKPTTLWALYSKLKTTISIKDNVDLEKYTKLKDFLKKQSKGYRPKKSKTLTTSQIEKFIKEAPDTEFLLAKVALIMGVAGACRKHELYHLTASNVEDLGTAVLITVPHSHTKEPRRFVLTGNFYNIFKKYADLRPPNTTDPYFFLSYMRGKCATHRMGINKFGIMGKQIAKFLKLPNAELYTGHCFRRSSATILDADEDSASVKIHAGWKSTTVADEFMTNQFGIANKILNALDNTTVATTSSAEVQGGRVYRRIAPKEPVIVRQEIDASSLKGPSTSILSSSENETNDRAYSVSEDPLAEEIYNDDEEDDDSEAEDKNIDMDLTDTQVLQNEVEPLRIDLPSESPSSKECDLFGEYIAKHLQRLPLEMALKLQSGIQALVMQTRLEYIRNHPSEAPAMVKKERSKEDSTRTTKTTTVNTNYPNDDDQVQNGTEKRTENIDQQPAAKRFKPNNSETNKSDSNTQQNQNRRTEYTVFAEHIALQLEQLPEDVSIQLQTEIYDLITQTYSKHTDDDVPNRVKIKDELLEIDPAELIDL